MNEISQMRHDCESVDCGSQIRKTSRSQSSMSAFSTASASSHSIAGTSARLFFGRDCWGGCCGSKLYCSTAIISWFNLSSFFMFRINVLGGIRSLATYRRCQLISCMMSVTVRLTQARTSQARRSQEISFLGWIYSMKDYIAWFGFYATVSPETKLEKTILCTSN